MPALSEDEEESRAGLIRKKAKVDPFRPRSEGKGGNANKEQVEFPGPLSRLLAVGEEQKTYEHEVEPVDDENADEEGAIPSSESPGKRKKNRHAKAEDNSWVYVAASPPEVLEKSTVTGEPGPSSFPTPRTMKPAKKVYTPGRPYNSSFDLFY